MQVKRVDRAVFEKAIRDMMALRTGVSLAFFGDLLEMYPLENSNYSVVRLGDTVVDDVSLDEALEAFLRTRDEHEIGFDIEAELHAKSDG